MNNNNYDFWFWLSVMANIAQLNSYQILLNDFDNLDLMKYLEHQDKLINTVIEQNREILSQNQEILKLLKEGKDNA